MKSQLAISHLIRHFLLFALTVFFLLTLVRAGFNLWQLDQVEDVQTLIRSFIQGSRFDLATVGMLLLMPIVFVPLLAMFTPTLSIARVISPLWFMLALLLVLLLELVTPYFLYDGGVRPDLAALVALAGNGEMAGNISQRFLIPAILGAVLVLMMLYAFWARMETNRFLRYPVKKIPAICLSIVGLVICVLAMRSSFDLSRPVLGPDAALISTEQVVNEISLNSTFKTVHNVYSNSQTLQDLSRMPAITGLKELMP